MRLCCFYWGIIGQYLTAVIALDLCFGENLLISFLLQEDNYRLFSRLLFAFNKNARISCLRLSCGTFVLLAKLKLKSVHRLS